MNIVRTNRASNTLVSLALSALAGTALLVTAGVANAAPTPDAAVTVNYGDLNVQTHDGAVTLYRRIASAAKLVCPGADNRNMAALAIRESCQRAAIERAVHGLSNPQLAAVHSEHFGRG